jgi:hypothetical protein
LAKPQPADCHLFRARVNNKQFSIRFYYDGEARKNLMALWECGLSEIIAAAWPFAEFHTEIIRLDAPQSIPKKGVIKYLRHEL